MSEIERPSSNSAGTTVFYERDPVELLDAAERAVQRLSNWTVTNRSEDRLDTVRSTYLLRFKDDVTVSVEPGDTPSSSNLTLTSASRVGRSDLGQNPRNLRELLDALDRELE